MLEFRFPEHSKNAIYREITEVPVSWNSQNSLDFKTRDLGFEKFKNMGEVFSESSNMCVLFFKTVIVYVMNAISCTYRYNIRC